jgi:hypothetical protein
MGAATSKGKVDEKLSNGIQKALNDKWVPIFMKLKDDNSSVQYASIVGEKTVTADTLENLANKFAQSPVEMENTQNQRNFRANAAAGQDKFTAAAKAGQANSGAANATRKLSWWEKQKEATKKQTEAFKQHKERVGAVTNAAGRGIGAAAGTAGRGIGAVAGTAGRGIGAVAGAAGRGIGAVAGAAGRGIGAAAGAAGRGIGAAAGAAGRGIGAAGRGIGAAAGAAGHGIGAAAAAGRKRIGNMFTRKANKAPPAANEPVYGPIDTRPTPENIVKRDPRQNAANIIAKRDQRKVNREAPSENVNLSSSPFSSNENEDPRGQTPEAIAKREQRAANKGKVPDKIIYAPGDRKNELAPNLFSGGYRRTTRRKYRKHL